MNKYLKKRLIALVLSGGILLSSTGVYTALAATEETTTSEYTSALEGTTDVAVTDKAEVSTEESTSVTVPEETVIADIDDETTTAPQVTVPSTESTTNPPETTTEKLPDVIIEDEVMNDNKADEWVGEGTEANPYQVSSVELFLKMSQLINDTGNANKYFKLTADIDFSNTTIDQTLINDYKLAEHTGIGGALVSVNPSVSSNSNVFFHLDGNGKQIKNVTMNFNSFNSLSIFGYLNSGSTIANLTVSKAQIINGYSDAQAAGIILKNDGTVKDCSFTEIELDTTASTTKAESFYPDNTTFKTYSGTAIVVDNSGVIDSETKYDQGALTVTAETVTVKTSRPYAGSMVAQNRGKINKVRARYITVHGSVTKSDYVGGLVGTNATQRTSSANGMYYCEIQKHDSAGGVKGADKIGYLVGHNTGRIQRATVEGRFNTNQQASALKYDLLVTGATAAGGIVGDNTGDVQLCTVTNVGVYFANTTDGAIYGGIAGKSNYNIRNCIATGSTAGEGDGSTITRYIGGIVGYGDTGSNFGVENCYALVKIIDSKAVLGAIVGFNGDTAYRNNRVRNVFYSAIISSRPSPVSFGGAGEGEGDLTFTRPYTLAYYNHLIMDGYDWGITKNQVKVSTSAFGFSGWGDAEISTNGSVFSGTQNTSYYTLDGLGTSTITYELKANGKADKTVVYYDVDITIPSSIGANNGGTTLADQPMELGILNAVSLQSGYTSDGFIGTKDYPISLNGGEENFLYHAPAAHFSVKGGADDFVYIRNADYTTPSATFWGTIDFKGAKIIMQCDKDLFKGIYGSRDDTLANNNSTTHKSDSSDEADDSSNLSNGVIKNLVVEITPQSGTIHEMEISSVFGNVCNATLKNTKVTFSNAVDILPQEGNTGLFAKAVYGNSYLYGCYVDNIYINGAQRATIKTSHDGVAGFVGVIDAEKAIIDNCGADIPVFPETQNMQNIAIFVGEIKSLKGGYIQNCYASGALIKSGGSFQSSSCNLFAGSIKSNSIDTNIYNCYYSPSYLYTNGVYKDGITTGIKSGSYTGSCKAWSFQMQNSATQLWGDTSLQVLAESQVVYLESINNIDRFPLDSYSNAATDLNAQFTATSSDTSKLTTTNFRWYGRIGLSTSFTGGKDVSASVTVRHNATGLAARLTAISTSDLAMDDDGFYLINTPADLYYLSVNQTKLAPGSTEYLFMRSEAKLRLGADIDMSGYTIDPIGSSANYFKGTFDGAGYTISNLTFDTSSLDHALFGYVQGATIKNLTIDNINISGTSYTGAIIGTVYDYALVDTCKVTNSNISGQNHVGGIVGGINEKSNAQATEIKNCTVENTTVTSTKKEKEHGHVGGIIGGTGMNNTDTCYAEITGCKVIDSTIESKAYGLGGIVGYAPNINNKVTSCEVTGTTITSGDASNGVTYASLGAVAGIFGGSSLSDCTVTDCEVTGECASGVVGRLINESGVSTISGCTVTNSTITAPDIAGGILAQVSAYATASCWGDKVVENCKVSEDTTVKALVAGGIVGSVQQFSNKNLTVSGCTFLGTAETTGKKGSITDAAGGIVGRLMSGLQTPGILVTGCLSQGTVKGNSNLGGIIGMNNANAHNGDNKLIKDCYVTSKFESSNLAVVKGLAIGYVGYSTKNNPTNLAENVVYSSLNTREILFGNITETSGGYDMNMGADQTSGITVDFTTSITNATLITRYFPYFLNSVVGYYDGMMGKSNTVQLRTNLYVGSSAFDNALTNYSNTYNGTTYSARLTGLLATTVPRFSVGNLPSLTGTDGNAFATPATSPFSTTASASKILVGCSTATGTTNATYNKLNDVSIQTFDKKCNATVKTTYTGIINGETVKFDVGFSVVVNGEHAYEGDGTEYNPFLIYTAEDLLAIKQHHDNPSAKDDFKDNPDHYYEAYYCIMNDIDMTEELITENRSFAPIGTEDEPFRGKITTYRDQQMKIINLLINDPKKNEDYAYNDGYTVTDAEGNKTVEYSDALGLFGYTDGAEIYNLELQNVNILAVPAEGNKFIGTKSGALVGYATNTIIDNVKVSGASSVAIEGSFGGRAGAVGGIVGWAADNVVMSNVQVIGTDNENRTVVKGQYSVGGIVGTAQNANGCSITDAYVENVNVTNLATSGVSISGGIAGEFAGVITGSDEVKDDEGNIITPETRIKVNNVTVIGTVVGGVVGSGNIANAAEGGYDLTIEKVDVANVTAEVTESVRNDTNASSNGIAGGILGQTKDSYHYYITDCTIDGNSTVTSGYCAGGIVGSASNRGKGQLQTETCLIISDCTTLAKVEQLNAPTTNTLTLGDSVKRKTGAGSVIGVITQNALVMNEDTSAPQIQIRNVTAGGEISGTFNVGGVIGEFSVFQGKLNELTESIITDCIVSARITALEAATERFGVILGSIEGNQYNSNNPNEQTLNIQAPFPEQDSNGNVLEYAVKPFDKIFYSSYTAGTYELYGPSAIKDYQDPVHAVFYDTIYDVNKVVYNFETDDGIVELPVSVVKDGFSANTPEASYQYFDYREYNFSKEFRESHALNEAESPFGFTLAGKDFALTTDSEDKITGIQSSNPEVFNVINNPNYVAGSAVLGARQFKIEVKQFNTADLVFTYTNGLQIGIPVICGVNFEGEGTAENPIQVSNADIFYHIVKVLPSYSFVQTADIDLSDKTKYPATSLAQLIPNFTGTYDGGNHSITGFDVTIEASEEPVGIFAKVSGVKTDENGEVIPNIKDLTFVNCSVNSGECKAGTGVAIGELANGAKVSNIKVENSTATSKLGNVGGAIGTVTGASTVDGVEVSGGTVSAEKGSAGGAIGTIVEDSAKIIAPVVKNTTVTVGSVDGDGNYEGGTADDIAGGIVAQAHGEIIGPESSETDADGNPVYVNAVEDVTVRALIAGGAVGAVYRTNQAEAEGITHILTLKDIRVSGAEVTAKSEDGTRATSGAGLLGFARAKTDVELNNCYVTNTTKTSAVASVGGVSYGAGAVANVDENVLSLKFIDVESYATVNSQEAGNDGTVHAASLVAYMDNAPEILSFDGCVAGGKVTGKAMKTFVGGVIGGFTDAFASNEITHELFKNGVISAELECVDGTSNNSTIKSVHRIGKFIAGFAEGMFVEANFSTMFSNNYYSTYPNDIAFFATESGDKGPLDEYLAQVENGFTDINNNNLEIADEFKSGWNKVAITKSIGSETTLYARLNEAFAELPYGSETNRRYAVAAGGFDLKETAKDADGKPISCIELVGSPSQTENIGEFELVVRPTDYGAEMLVAEYNCGLKTTAQIISVEIEGEGSEESPFLISTPTQLRVVAYLTVGNYHFRQINDIDLSNSYAETGTDTDKFIHNNGKKFYAPIGTETAPFDGVYDGQGYKITGVKSDRGNENNIGVFGFVKQNGTLVPTIKNLHVELMATDNEKAQGIVGNENVGGIAGKIENAVIENCSVTVGTVTGKQNVGGIAGHFTSSRIINCFTQSDVNAFNSEREPYAGGIVGYVFDAINVNSTISGCFASGSIFASSRNADVDRSNAAGIVSYLENSTYLVIDNCLFTGTTSSGIGIVGNNGKTKFILSVTDCIDAGQNIAMENDRFTKIPTAVAHQLTRVNDDSTGLITMSNLYYDNALLKVDTENHPDTESIKGRPTSALIDTTSVSMGDGWTVVEGYYPVPVVSEITVTTYDENYAITAITTKTDPYSDAYAKFLSVPIQTSESEEESNIEATAYGKGLVYPVTLLTNVYGNKVTYSSSIFDTTDTVAYPEGFDPSLYGGVLVQVTDEEGNITYVDNKNVDLLFGDDAETGKTTVYRNIFDTTKGIADRGKFETKPTKNTYVNAGAPAGNVFSNGEAYYNAQVPVVFATANINGVDVQRDIKIALNHGETYCIATQRQLYALGLAEYELVDGAKFSNYYGSTYNYKLITDIDCGDNETLFTPIGSEVDEGYTGQFDGSGHTIKNLKIKSTGNNVGMFSKLSKNWNSPYDPFIKNLTLVNATVEGNDNVGTLVGEVFGSGEIVIENCHAIGEAEYDEKGNIVEGSAKGTVTGTGSYIGGLIGKVEYPSTVIKSCSSSVLVSGSKDAVGGLIGNSGATITSCYATGNVVCDYIYNNANTTKLYGVGGLIGIMSDGTVTQSFASGNVEVKAFTAGNNAFVEGTLGIGGFVGVLDEVNTYDSEIKQFVPFEGDAITECFSGGNVKFGTINDTSAVRPYSSTAIVGIGGFSGVNKEGIAHVYSSAAVNATFGDIIARNNNSNYGVGIGGVAGVALGNVEDVYSSGSVAPAYASIDSTNNPDNCYFGKGGTVGTKMGTDVTVRYCYYDSWTNTDPTLTSIGGQDNDQDARGLTTLELTSGKKPANATFSDVWGFTPNAYPYLRTLLNEESDPYIKTNSILSVVCVDVAYDDVSAKTGAGITQALTVPSEFVYLDENMDSHPYKLLWEGATLEGNLAAIRRTRNTREYVDVVAQVEGYEKYATRVYSRLCADMKGTFEQPYLIGNEEDLNHVNMTADELEVAKEAYTGFYDQWATPLGDGNEQVEGTVHYQLMSNIGVDDTVRKIPTAPGYYTYSVATSDANGDLTTKDVNFNYQGFMLKGNGYSIKNVATEGSYISMVDEKSTISNIIFEDFTFTGSNSAIVGINNGTLQDIYVKSTMGDGTSDISNVAGLVLTNTGTIDGCIVDATIKGAQSNAGVMAVTNNGTIKNSGTAGTLDTSEGSDVQKIGAFVVSNNKTIEDSFSMADVNVLAAENATVNHISGFAAINKGTMDGVYTRSAVSFANAPADTLTVGSLVGEITSTEAEPITNSYAAGLLGYYNDGQDSILFGTVPSTMNKLSSVYVDKSLAGEKSANSYKYSASLSSIMSMEYMPGAMKYDATNNPNGTFIAGDTEKLVLPQLTSILNAENHQVVDASGNLIYVDTSVTDKVVTYTLFTETDEESGESVRKYRCSDGNVYFADGEDNVVGENGTVIVPVENLKLQYAIYLEDKVVIRNYDVIKLYSQISSMTIKTGQSQYADRLAPNSSSLGLNSQVSNVDGIQFNLVNNNGVVGVNNTTHVLSTTNTAGSETIKVANRNAIKLTRGMEIQPTLYIDVAVNADASEQLNPNFSGGIGTKENPYVISDASSLTSLHYYGTESNLYFVLGNDIDMSGVEDFQIHNFTAHLNDPDSLGDPDSDNYKPHQYAIQNFTSTEGHGGLFGTIEDGAVVNNVALTGTIEGGEQFTGALANIINGATVTNCVVSAEVTSTATADEYSTPATGILAGKVSEGAVISGIVTTGNVSIADGYAGGVIGSAQYATISEILSTANVGEGDTAGIIGNMGEEATLTNALYGGVAQSKNPIVGTYVDETAITETYYDNQTNKNIEEGTVIGTGKTTKECEKLTFDDMFMYVDENGGYYPVPVTIVDTIGVGGETPYEGYGSTAALAAATMNFYLGSSYGQIGYYTSMQFINKASGSDVTATEEGNGNYFSIVSGEKVYTIKTAKYNEEKDPGISFSLENGAVRTVYPGLVRNANITYTIVNSSDLDLTDEPLLGVLFKSVAVKGSSDKVQVLNDFTNEIGTEQKNIDALAIAKELDGFYVGEMLPDGYEYEITATLGGEVIPSENITVEEGIYGTYIKLPDVKDAEGNTATDVVLTLTIVEAERPWGVNSVKNILW